MGPQADSSPTTVADFATEARRLHEILRSLHGKSWTITMNRFLTQVEHLNDTQGSVYTLAVLLYIYDVALTDTTRKIYLAVQQFLRIVRDLNAQLTPAKQRELFMAPGTVLPNEFALPHDAEGNEGAIAKFILKVEGSSRRQLVGREAARLVAQQPGGGKIKPAGGAVKSGGHGGGGGRASRATEPASGVAAPSAASRRGLRANATAPAGPLGWELAATGPRPAEAPLLEALGASAADFAAEEANLPTRTVPVRPPDGR
jgi:hypothetical protein